LTKIQNNITRFLSARKIPFEAHELTGEKKSAKEVAGFLNIPLSRLFKTLVLKPISPGKPILAIIPADKIADLKKIAKIFNEKKLEFPPPQEAEKLTGLQTGGISPLALINKGFRIVVDDSATEMNWMHISGGQRGLNIKLNPQDLIAIINAKTGAISKDFEEDEKDSSLYHS